MLQRVSIFSMVSPTRWRFGLYLSGSFSVFWWRGQWRTFHAIFSPSYSYNGYLIRISLHAIYDSLQALATAYDIEMSGDEMSGYNATYSTKRTVYTKHNMHCWCFMAFALVWFLLISDTLPVSVLLVIFGSSSETTLCYMGKYDIWANNWYEATMTSPTK